MALSTFCARSVSDRTLMAGFAPEFRPLIICNVDDIDGHSYAAQNYDYRDSPI